MTDAKAPSELTALRREYKEATGKNPSPKLKAEELSAKIAEAKTSPAEAAANEKLEPDSAKAEKPEAEPEADAPKGTALLDHDDPNAAATHEGVEIVRGRNGLYLAPLAFVPALEPHGFRLIRAGK